MGNGDAVKHRLNRFRQLAHLQAVAAGFLAVDLDRDLGDVDLLFQHQVFDPFDGLHDLQDLLPFLPQHIQVIAVNLDRHLRADARQDFVHAMRNELADIKDSAGDLRQIRTDAAQ